MSTLPTMLTICWRRILNDVSVPAAGGRLLCSCFAIRLYNLLKTRIKDLTHCIAVKFGEFFLKASLVLNRYSAALYVRIWHL